MVISASQLFYIHIDVNDIAQQRDWTGKKENLLPRHEALFGALGKKKV